MQLINTGRCLPKAPVWAGVILLSSMANSLELMSAAKLSHVCEASLKGQHGVENSACAAYLLGYIEANAKVRITDGTPRNFTERAIVSRAPGGSTSIETLRRASYCLSRDTEIDELASRIVAESGESKTGSAFSLVTRVLKDHYPC